MSDLPSIASRRTVFETPYFSLVEKVVRGVADQDPYYAIHAADYVTCIAITDGGQVVLVRQYRPAVESECLEFPSGHVDAGESPVSAARRELNEETGFDAAQFVEVGCLKPDVGRLGNRLWCVVARGARPLCTGGGPAEAGITPVVVSAEAFKDLLARQEFDHALNLAALLLAIARGVVPSSYAC